MRITALSLHANPSWPGLRCDTVRPGLNVFHGPPGSAKTTLADLVAHALYGRRLARLAGASLRPIDGELTVLHDGQSFRLRRNFEEGGHLRLTVAGLNGASVDRDTVREFLSGLTPELAAPVFAPNGSADAVDQLLAHQFLNRFLSIGAGEESHGLTARKAELVARRDALARELELKIAGDRLESRTLDERWHQLEKLVKETEAQVAARRERLRAVDTALAEVEARLRYLELEATIGQQPGGPIDNAEREQQLTVLDEQIGQWRTMLAKLQQREASVRGKLAQVRPDDEDPGVTLADQRAWLAMARQWAADLDTEVARLARATEMQSCVCHDAHPRLQPIANTIVRQLGVLESLVDQQQRAAQALELAEEADDLARSQLALERQLDHLLARRQSTVREAKPSLRPRAWQGPAGEHDELWRDLHELDQRRWQLQKEHGEVLDALAALEPRLREQKADRDAVDRQRAGLLSAQSIDGLRAQLAAVQRQLECASHAPDEVVPATMQVLATASDYLAQLTDGGYVGIQFAPDRGTWVVNRAGGSVLLPLLSVAERRQVHLATCLALASACESRGLRLPLVLDEPFAELGAAEAAILATVLDDAARRGHQVLVFTGRQSAADRFAALGAAVLPMRQLLHSTEEAPAPVARPIALRKTNGKPPTNGRAVRPSRSPASLSAATGKRKKRRRGEEEK